MGKFEKTALCNSHVSPRCHCKSHAFCPFSEEWHSVLIFSNLDFANISIEILEILGNLAFISARFGYSAFDEWNFVYLAAIDLLAAYPLESASFIQKHVPGKHF